MEAKKSKNNPLPCFIQLFDFDFYLCYKSLKNKQLQEGCGVKKEHNITAQVGSIKKISFKRNGQGCFISLLKRDNCCICNRGGEHEILVDPFIGSKERFYDFLCLYSFLFSFDFTIEPSENGKAIARFTGSETEKCFSRIKFEKRSFKKYSNEFFIISLLRKSGCYVYNKEGERHTVVNNFIKSEEEFYTFLLFCSFLFSFDFIIEPSENGKIARFVK